MGDMQVLKCAIVLRERRNRVGEAESVREREREVLNLSAAARFTCCSVIGNGWLVQEEGWGEWQRNWERSFFAWVCFINKLFAQLARRVVQLPRRREPAGRGKRGGRGLVINSHAKSQLQAVRGVEGVMGHGARVMRYELSTQARKQAIVVVIVVL